MELLLSTCDAGLREFMDGNPRLNADICIIHQVADDALSPDLQGWPVRTRYLRFAERGLSRSRNRALAAASAEICLIADDDVIFYDEGLQRVEDAFLRHPEADIITFQMETPFKKYRQRGFWHNGRTIASVTSPEMAFRLESVLRAGLHFDERFGLGAKYVSGEEFIFLSDALERGLRIRYEPIAIVRNTKQTSGYRFNRPDLLFSKGAMMARVFGRRAPALLFLFAIKKYPQYRRYHSFRHCLGLLHDGYNDFMRGDR